MNKFTRLVIVLFISFIYFICAPTIHADVLKENWDATTPLPRRLASHTSFALLNKVFVINGSGQTGNTLPDVLEGEIVASGNILGWDSIALIDPPLIWHATSHNDNYAYILGGYIDDIGGVKQFLNTVLYSDISSGSPQFWTNTTTLDIPLSLGSSLIVDNNIYYAGGFSNNVPDVRDKVYYAPIHEDGSLGSWTETTPLRQPLYGFGMIETGNKLIVIGGVNLSQTVVNSVYEADILPGGGLGDWIEKTGDGESLPIPIAQAGVVKIGNNVVVVGGKTNGGIGDVAIPDVYYAPINEDGSLGTWTQSEHSLPEPRCCGSLAASDTHLYYSGGHLPGNGYFDDVYFARYATTNNNPLILLPGYGGSWNYDALIHDEEGIPDTQWGITPFVNVYDNIIATLSNNEEGVNLYEYPYDWRNDASVTAGNLYGFIDSILASEGKDKVNLIGHSFGGLIARAYAQNNPDKVDKLLTVGTPHEGVTKTYKIWEGADFSDFSIWEEAALRLYLRKKAGLFGSKVETIQNLSPSLLNVWPTFDFIKNKEGDVIPLSSLNWQNNFIPNLSAGLPNILEKLSTLSGEKDSSTTRFIKVENPSSADILFGKWKDGKPVGEENETGDTTVLLSSSQMEGADNIVLPGFDHTEIISRADPVSTIQEYLGLTGPLFITNLEDIFEYIVVTVSSPVTFVVKLPNGEILTPIDNLLIIKNPEKGEYTVTVTGIGEGEYTIYFGRIKENDEAWSELKDAIVQNQPKQHDFYVNFNEPNLGSDPNESISSILDYLKNTIENSDTRRPSIIVMLASIRNLERTINLWNRTKRQRPYENLLRLVYHQIEQIKNHLNKWPWTTLNEEENGKIAESLNKILYLVEESYFNKYPN